MPTHESDASQAARLLSDPETSEPVKEVAASDLADAGAGHTHAETASEAARILDDKDASPEERSVAASDLAQARRDA